MHCPACKSPSFETAAECGSCGLSLERADGLFGAPPPITPTVADLAGVLSKSDRRAIGVCADELHSRFPQVHFTTLTIALPADVSLAVYTFWIFNRGGICREIERGAANHDILLTIDPENSRSNLIVGYGLEPFVPTEKLDAALQAAAPAFAQKNYAAGVRSTVSSLSETLVSIAANIPTTYGLNPSEVRPRPAGSGEF